MSYLDLTIKDMHDALVSKKVTPFELVSEAINRLKNDDNNAVEYLIEKEALDYAKTLTTPEEDNLLWGIPFAVKDNLSTKGIPTTGSCNILNDYVPIFDATVVSLLKKRKAVMIAKTTLDELAMGGTGATGHLGKTYNPYDKSHERMVGGSSCGSASVVASGVVPFALGSDTGDSIRKPASLAGLVGFKPTWSRISRFGLFPFAPSLDTIGYFTRSVDDAAILLNVLAGKDEKDFTSSNLPTVDYVKTINNDIKGAKIAVIQEIIDTFTDQDILKQFKQTLEIYKSLGATVDYVHVDKHLMTTIFSTYYIISCAEATSNNANLDGIKFGNFENADTYIDVMKKVRTKGFSERIKRRFIIGSYSLMKENQNELFLRAAKNRHKIVDSFNAILDKYDAIFLPAAPSIAPKFDAQNDQLKDEYLVADNYMAIGNFGGYPSITIPTGFKDNMPFGFNLTSKPFADAKLLNLAKALESKLPFYNLSVRTKK